MLYEFLLGEIRRHWSTLYFLRYTFYVILFTGDSGREGREGGDMSVCVVLLACVSAWELL